MINPGGLETYNEIVDPTVQTPNAEFTDVFASGSDDQLVAEAGSPSAPMTPVDPERRAAPGDQAFVDVDLFIN